MVRYFKKEIHQRIFKDEESLELVESIMTLEPGDLIFTGTNKR